MTASSNFPPAASKTTLVDLTENDLKELAAFVADQSGRDVVRTLEHLKWLLLENPARHESAPVGCGVRAADGRLVGCILYLPQMFVFNQTPLLLVGSSCFYVHEAYRGSGGPVFLKFSRYANQSPLFGNSANAMAAQIWKARGATPIRDSDCEVLGVIHWPPVLEELARRRGAGTVVSHLIASTAAWAGRLKKLKLRPGQDSELVKLDSVEDIVKLRLDTPSGSLTSLRSELYLRWRYFSNDPTVATFAFCNKMTRKKTFVAVNMRPRGHRGQIRSLNLLDVFPKPEPDQIVAIAAALYLRYRNDADMIVVRGQDSACRQALTGVGFRRRDFEAPNGWVFDPRQLLPTRDWYFVPGDGDWII